jgi:hypothetical protein
MPFDRLLDRTALGLARLAQAGIMLPALTKEIRDRHKALS